MGFSKGVFRYFLLFLLLVLSVSFCFALVVDSTGFEGVNPVMYGEFVVFESVNGSVGVLDIYRNEVFDFGQGSNPSLFGLNIVFESNEDGVDSVIKLVDIRSGDVFVIGVGRNPFVFGRDVFFSVKEFELGLDLNLDGDLSDDILHVYNMDSRQISNLNVIGDFPVANQDFVVFLTDEV